MKRCAYCGRENDPDAARCRECGTEFAVPPRVSEPLPPLERIATLQNEVEAQRLEIELRSGGIPHVLISYADSAFDGIFQTVRGWGHVEAAKDHRDAVLTILKEIRQSRLQDNRELSEQSDDDDVA
ncbi:MAG: zinc ribbon domain-containing protein [Chloroflexi bacterium]|nr:zinc ribbon domain-containing protein [Chloroflexota bacterium]